MALPQIGASMVHLLGASSRNPPSAGNGSSALEESSSTAGVHPTVTPKNSSYTQPTMPCLLLPGALLADDDDNHDSSPARNSRRILVQGPSKSGRTSLAMNLAYACAAATAATAAATGETNSTTRLPCHCLLQPCRCTTVVMYRKASSSRPRTGAAPPPPPTDFPLPCRYSGVDPQQEHWRGGVNPQSNMPGADVLDAANGEEEEAPCWDSTILGRVRIQYVRSARDILQDLLGLLGRPLHEHPTRAIIIDDLDQICGGGEDHDLDVLRSAAAHGTGGRIWEQHGDKGRSSETAISIMQTLAVAVDTSHALQRLHGELPFVLASTSSRTKIVAPWMDTLVTLSSSSSSTTSAGTGHGGIPATSQCKWKADFRGTFSSRGCTTAWFLTVDYYSVLNHPVDGPFIEWKRGDAASMR